MALSQGAVAMRNNTVSVGNAATGLNRQISNIAPSVLLNYAANVGQLQQDMVASSADSRTFAVHSVTCALAMPQMTALAPGKLWVSVAAGNYASANAVGVTFGYQVTMALGQHAVFMCRIKLEPKWLLDFSLSKS